MSASPGDHEFILAMGPVARELLGEPTEDNRAKRGIAVHRDIALMRAVSAPPVYTTRGCRGGETIALAGATSVCRALEGDGADRNLPILEARPFRGGVGGQFLDRHVERNIGQHQHVQRVGGGAQGRGRGR